MSNDELNQLLFGVSKLAEHAEERGLRTQHWALMNGAHRVNVVVILDDEELGVACANLATARHGPLHDNEGYSITFQKDGAMLVEDIVRNRGAA